jgi:hypothetical protein
MSNFNQGVPGVATLINSSATILSGNAASANALTVRQFGGGNVFSAQTTTGSTALFVGANGYVGVGTTGPGWPLDVLSSGTRVANFVSSANGSGNIRFQCTDGTTPGTGFIGINAFTNSVFGLGSSTAIPTALYQNGTEYMRIHTNGNVGIGTASPGYQLEVVGIGNMIAATNLQSTVTQMMGTNTTIGFSGTKTNHSTYIVSNNGAGGNIVLNAAGTALFPLTGSTCELGGASNRWSTIYAVNALNTSDRNLKENISDAPLGIDFVNALNPRTFTWKEYTQTVVNPVTDEPRTVTKPAGTRLQYGLIAQEVKDVLDKFGIDPKDFAGYVDSTVNEPDKPQVLYLNYIQFIPILIKSVKELSAENITLKTQMASLEQRLSALESKRAA